ncbi:MAG: sigma-70 family RNA polymerase sigma factor [Nocardioidaceae bacterium]
MSQPVLSDPTTPSDAELIAAVRGGDIQAYGLLFARHRQAAIRLARQIAGSSDADDLVSDAFAKVLNVLRHGGGPDVAFRAYLLTAVRRLHVDRIRAGKHLVTTDEMEAFDPGVPFRDPALSEFENSAAAKAFASLPERWQLVLWHLEVEGQKPADIGPLLGLSANSVSALAYRAREGLRQAYIQMHLADTGDEDCRWVTERLGAHVRNGLSKRDAAKVDEHLKGCTRCAAAYLELTDVNSNLSAIVAPLLLGTAAAGYLTSTSSSGAGGLLLLAKARHVLKANPAAAAGATAAGVAVAAAVTAVFVVGLGGPHNHAASNLPVRTSVTTGIQTPGTTPSTLTHPRTSGAHHTHPAGSTNPGSQPTPTRPTPTRPTTTQISSSLTPVAQLHLTTTQGSAPLRVTVNASGSTDPAGGALTYAFNFGDSPGGGGKQPGRLAGLTGSLVVGNSPIATHVYRTVGTFTLRVTITDALGLSTTKSRTITVTPPALAAPTARLTLTPSHGLEPLTVSADASASTDPQGEHLTYAFDFGDGTHTATRHRDVVQHIFKAAGTYDVTVRVTDSSGLSSTASQPITVSSPVVSTPAAALTVTADPGHGRPWLSVKADAKGSSDPQHEQLTYTFCFNTDPATGTCRGDLIGPQHALIAHETYTTPGTYLVTLTVTNTSGLTNTARQSITLAAVQPPTATLTVSPDTGTGPLMVTADGSKSSDPQDEQLTYSYDFGDGTAAVTGTESSATHQYYTRPNEAQSTYRLTLTVTNSSGLTSIINHDVIVTASPPTAALNVTPDTGTWPLPVTVDAGSSADPQGESLTYDFDFGDGYDTGKQVANTAGHTYAAPGSYTVTVTVTNSAGLTATATQPVTVTDSMVDLGIASRPVVVGPPKNGVTPERIDLNVTMIPPGALPPDSAITVQVTNPAVTGRWPSWLSIRATGTGWVCTPELVCTTSGDNTAPIKVTWKVPPGHSGDQILLDDTTATVAATFNDDPNTVNNSVSWKL